MDVNSLEIRLKGLHQAAFLAFAVLVLWLPISSAAVEICVGIIMLLLILKGAIQRPSLGELRDFLKDPTVMAALLLYIGMGLSLLSSPLFAKSLRALVTKWGEGLLLLYSLHIFLTRFQVRALLMLLFISTLIVGLDGIYQKIYGVDLIRGIELMRLHGFVEVSATFNHYNNFGTFLAVMFFLSYGALLSYRKIWAKCLFVLLALLILANLFLTYSKGAWLSVFGVSLLGAVFGKQRGSRLFFLALAAAFLVAVVTVPSLRERLWTFWEKGGDLGRIYTGKAAVLMFLDSPILGRGLGTFMDYLDVYLSPSMSAPMGPVVMGYQYAHNCFLQLLAETGLVGFIPFLFLLAQLFYRGLCELRRRRNAELFGLLAGLSAYLMHAAFDNPLYNLRLSVFFWVLVGFISLHLRDAVPVTAEEV